MRCLRLTTNYPGYLDQFYARSPELAAEPYDIQHAKLMEDCFGWSDFWSTSLAKLGYESAEIVANARPMQTRWADEHGLTYEESKWALEIAAAQIRDFRPNVLLVNDYHSFSGDFLRWLKSECQSIKLTLGWCGAPYSDASVFGAYDVVLSCIPELVAHFQAQGHACVHMNHAFEPRILGRINRNVARSINFSFIGSIVRQKDFHRNREELLTELAKRTDLQIWSDLPPPQARVRAVRSRRLVYDSLHIARTAGVPQSLLQALPVIGNAARWNLRPNNDTDLDECLRRRIRPAIFGIEMFQKLYESRIALNTHIDISPESASNMRLFEATGVGSCLLTDWKANLPTLFAPDTEVVAYRKLDECVEKVRYLLDHEAECLQIARAGQARTLRDHTFDRRAEILDGIIRLSLKK